MPPNVKKKVKKIRMKCTFCNRKHCPNVNVGNNVGDGSALATNIAKNNGTSVKNYKSTHELGTHFSYVNKKGSTVNDYQLQAHHLICSESMDDGDKGKRCWMNLCAFFGYDINCFENGVFLPSSLESACSNRVPLHKGDHDATFGINIGINYVDSVKRLIILIKKHGNTQYCDSPEKFKKDLDAKSKEILGYVKSFRWTITADGRDYQGIVGCLNCKNIQEKRYKLYVDNFSKTEKQVDNMVSSSGALAMQTKVSAAAKTLKLFCNSEEHKTHKGRRKDSFPLKIGK